MSMMKFIGWVGLGFFFAIIVSRLLFRYLIRFHFSEHLLCIRPRKPRAKPKAKMSAHSGSHG